MRKFKHKPSGVIVENGGSKFNGQTLYSDNKHLISYPAYIVENGQDWEELWDQPPGILEMKIGESITFDGAFGAVTNNYNKWVKGVLDAGGKFYKIRNIDNKEWTVGESIIFEASGKVYQIIELLWQPVFKNWWFKDDKDQFISLTGGIKPKQPVFKLKDEHGNDVDIFFGDTVYKLYPGNQWKTAERKILSSTYGKGGGLTFPTKKALNFYIKTKKPIFSEQSVIDAFTDGCAIKDSSKVYNWLSDHCEYIDINTNKMSD